MSVDTPAESLHCQSCGAPMVPVLGQRYFYCEYCGSYLFPKASEDGIISLSIESDLSCPLCAATLSEAYVSEVRVLYCSHCRGIVAGQEAFSTIIKYIQAQASNATAPNRPLEREALERELICPQCNQKMSTHPYCGPGNIVIDNCLNCALVWLDCGELTIIRNTLSEKEREMEDLHWLSDMLDKR